MKILVIHEGFPGQPRELVRMLGANPENDVRFMVHVMGSEEIPGVKKIFYPMVNAAGGAPGPLAMFERQVNMGYGAVQGFSALKKEGFIPDLIYGHSGWGVTLFAKDVFERTPVGVNFEWYYSPRDPRYNYRYMPAEEDLDSRTRIRLQNSIWLHDFASADRCVVATEFQKSQFPERLKPSMDVIHEGINTTFFKPNKKDKLILPRLKLDLSEETEIVTYATRGFEEIRGFPEFIEAVYHLQQRRPKAHVVIAGQDKVFYGGMDSLPLGSTWKSLMLEKFKLDMRRVHFVGNLNLEEYRTLLRNSRAHVYLTWPFVTSWSLMEAMSCECLVLGSATGGVEELITHEQNGLLVDFHNPMQQAEVLNEVLSKPKNYYDTLRKKARETILAKYDLEDCMRRKLQWLSDLSEMKV